MGCVQLKKKDDSEIIKSNIPPEIINNVNENYQIEITKQNNKDVSQNKKIISRDSKNPNVLNINNYVKNSYIKEKNEKNIKIKENVGLDSKTKRIMGRTNSSNKVSERPNSEYILNKNKSKSICSQI
jgi:archaellin